MLDYNHIIHEIKTRLFNLVIIQIWVLRGICTNDYPHLIQVPRHFIYASSVYDPISFNVKMSPSDSKFLILTARYSESSQSPRYEFHTLFNSSKDFLSISSSFIEHLTITVTSQINRNLNLLSVNITLFEWIRLQSYPIHIRVISDSGSLVSSPFKIQLYDLAKFEETGNEHIEFVMGNVAQILCNLPISKPSPPKISFQHNSNLINISNSSRYKLVEFPPSFNKVALLIRNLLEDDSGKYKCISYLPNTKFYQISDKTTHLIVKKPTEKIQNHFLMSSHNNIDDSKIIEIKVPEQTMLVLYCIYESAPIEEVHWYWLKSDRKYEIDPHFGTLTIHNVSLRDNTDISCMNNEDKVFRIHVYKKPRLVAKPTSVEISKENFNKKLIIKCEYNQKDNGFYIVHWLFNGEVTYDDREFEITNNSLIIRKLSAHNQGLYQCWTEIKNKWYSESISIYFPPANNKENNIYSQKIIRVDQGMPADLRCQIPANYDTSNTSVEWFRQNSHNEISKFNKNYIKYADLENNQYVLKIKNPQIKINSDVYICKLFPSENRNVLLRKIHFKLLTNKISKQNQPPDPSETVPDSSSFFTITKPNASLPESFLLAVNVSWSLKISVPDVNQSKIVSHYRVEYKQGSPKYRPIRWRSEIPLINWGNATILDRSVTKTSCLILSSSILKPQYWYSFRAVGIPNIKYVQLKFPRKKKYFSSNFFDNIRSSWSDPVNFEHILPFRPRITNITLLTYASASVSWIYGPLTDILNYQSERNIEFKILYRALSSDIKLQKHRPRNEQIYDLLYILENNDLLNEKMEMVTKISAYHNEFHELNLTNLKPNSQYIIALYAIHRPLSGMSKMYTTLSDPYITDTLSFENKIPVINNNANYSPKNETITHSNYFRNKILFLVLGSLAGILFVIALFMFIICVWYQISYHNKKRQNISSTSSVKTSSANTFAPISTMSQIQNNSAFVASSNIVSPQVLSPWTKTNCFPVSSEFPHLYLAQHLSLWSPNHLAQFNLPNHLQDQLVEESKCTKPSISPTTLSTPSPKSNIDIEINNLDGSIEDSQEESVRLLDYQSHSSCFKREEQCTLNNAFSVKSEGRERQNDQIEDHVSLQFLISFRHLFEISPTHSGRSTNRQTRKEDASSENAKSISHYPFSPSALELYSHKKKSKVCSSNRKDLSNIKLHLKQPKLQNSNYFLPIRSRLSCFFPSAPSGESPPPCAPIIVSLCKENSLNQYIHMKKDETFAEHPFLTTDLAKNGCVNNYGNGSYKYQYSPANNSNNQKLPSKFIYDPIHDLQSHEDSQSNSTAASARQFLFSLYPDGVRPCINLDLDKQGTNNQTNL